ncbi:MAG: N-acetyltransferase [Pedobacter sp.]|nr:MAG: N-acetyltransferase [Pedobacter sp.]
MKIEHTDDKKRGFFLANDNGVKAGKMDYVWAGENKFIIEHTEASPEYSGKGIGKKLVYEAVAFARSKNVKILPLCTFAKSVFDKNPDIADVLF